MNKGLYTLLICFSGLSAVCGVLQGIISFLLGPQIFFMEFFVPWFWAVNIISLSGAVLLLKYYHYRKYWFAFSAGAISAIASSCYVVVIYIVIVLRKLETFRIPVLLLFICAGIVYAVSLIFSSTGKRPWLKASGVLILAIGLVLGATVIWSISSQSFQIKSTLGKIAQWTSMAACLIPIPFIMHFISELRIMKKGNAGMPRQRSLENIMGTVGIVAFICALIFGVAIASESYSSLYWSKWNFERTKELARLFEARTFVNGKGDTLLYRLLKPLNYDATRKYPLVVSLPYGGRPATDKIRQIEGAAAAEMLSSDINRSKYPAFLFIPNCPPGSGWGGIPNYPSVDSLVYEAINSLDSQFGIDVKRRYVTGISRGGYGTWHFICTRPDMFAAAIPVCGAGDPKLAPNIVNVAVWAFHGKNDKNVPVSGSRDMISAMRKAGGNPKYTEFPAEEHNIWYQVSMTPGLLDWMFAQKRD